MSNVTKPVLHQVLATSSPRPEGIVTVPSRDLFAVANEVDLRSAKYRASISIYQLANSSNYPSLLSDARDNMTQGPFIPFSALSGLAASPGFGSPPTDSTVFYSVDDSFFRQNRIFTIQLVPGGPSRVTSEVRIRDSGNKLLQALAGFSSVTNTNVINVDGTVNIDPEGICLSSTPSTAWIASEGSGDGVITLPNLLLRVNLTSGEILSAVTLPAEVNSKQLRFGFEGVAEYGNWTVVTFQRAWTNETSPRIGLYNFVTAVWKFVFYPLDAVGSPNGGWVGLSDITSIGNGRFLILERDDQAGPDAVVKRLYEINLGANLTAVTPDSNVTKTLKLDLIPSLAQTWGLIPEKVEGVTIDAKGNVWVNNDNDGMGSGFVITSGEQQLNNVGQLYSPPATVPAPKAPPVTAPLATPVTAPVTPPVVPPRKKCGLFKLSVFCLNGCGVVGRLLKICKK